MRKQSGLFGDFVEGWRTLGDAGQFLAAGTLLASAGLGTVLGNLSAKATASSSYDTSAMGRAYDAERTDADIDYLASRLNMEYKEGEDAKKRSSRRSARVLGL